MNGIIVMWMYKLVGLMNRIIWKYDNINKWNYISVSEWKRNNQIEDYQNNGKEYD